MKSKWVDIFAVLFLIWLPEHSQADESGKKNNDKQEKTVQEAILSPEEKHYLLTLTSFLSPSRKREGVLLL